jgi:hypothetical protein
MGMSKKEAMIVATATKRVMAALDERGVLGSCQSKMLAPMTGYSVSSVVTPGEGVTLAQVQAALRTTLPADVAINAAGHASVTVLWP